MDAWIWRGSNQGALVPTWVKPVIFLPTCLIECSQNALEIGTPRTLPVLAREGWLGLYSRPWQADR